MGISGRSRSSLLLAAASALAISACTASAQSVIDNGTVALGVQPQGNIIFNGIGITFIPTNGEALAPGCACEGWGIADLGVANAFAKAGEAFGDANVTVDSFTAAGAGTLGASALSAISIVNTSLGLVGEGSPSLRITHDFAPAPETPNLYRVAVTIENDGATPIGRLVYRRAMDWDVPPTEFAENVTILGTQTSARLLASSNDGFVDGNPNVPLAAIAGQDALNKDFIDLGPSDHGAAFDFDFGALAPGDQLSFVIYYGAAATEAEALLAVQAVGAELVSFGQPSSENGETLGVPNTFIFAFEGVGGIPINGAQQLFLNVYRDMAFLSMQGHTDQTRFMMSQNPGNQMVVNALNGTTQNIAVNENVAGLPGTRAWVAADARIGSFDRRDGSNSEFDYRGGGMTLGVDMMLPRGTMPGFDARVGASLSYQFLSADVNGPAFGDLSTDAGSVNLFFDMAEPVEGLGVNAILSFGAIGFDQTRLAGGQAFLAHTTGLGFGADVEGSYRLAPIPVMADTTVQIAGFGGVALQHRTIDGFQESNGGVLVGDITDTSLVGRIGARATMVHAMPEGDAFVSGEVSFGYDFLEDDDNVLINAGALASQPIAALEDAVGRLTLSAGMDLDETMRGAVSYSGAFSQNTMQHALTATLEVRF